MRISPGGSPKHSVSCAQTHHGLRERMWERMMSGEDSQLACRVGFGVYLVACRTSAYMRTRRQCSDRQNDREAVTHMEQRVP